MFSILQSLCFSQGLSVIVHEFGHSAGLYHEQSRPDRDENVDIRWENIGAGGVGNSFRLFVLWCKLGKVVFNISIYFFYDSSWISFCNIQIKNCIRVVSPENLIFRRCLVGNSLCLQRELCSPSGIAGTDYSECVGSTFFTVDDLGFPYDTQSVMHYSRLQ